MCVFDGTYYKITTTNYISKTSLYTTFRMYTWGPWPQKILMFALLVTREIATQNFKIYFWLYIYILSVKKKGWWGRGGLVRLWWPPRKKIIGFLQTCDRKKEMKERISQRSGKTWSMCVQAPATWFHFQCTFNLQLTGIAEILIGIIQPNPGKDIVLRFIIEYSSLRDFGPLGNNNRSVFILWRGSLKDGIFWLVLKLEISSIILLFALRSFLIIT